MAQTKARVKYNIITKQAQLTTTVNSDKGSAFVSQVNNDVADDLGVSVKRATTNHMQTIGMFEGAQASLKSH